jgi:hypothetical protein
MGACISPEPIYLPLRPEPLPPLRSAANLAHITARFPPPYFAHTDRHTPYCLVHKLHPCMPALLAARSDEDWVLYEDTVYRVRYALLEQVLYRD